MTGILLVDKPVGPTSHDAVAIARRALGVRRIGHFGTLDPFASGLLVLGVGPATRLAPFGVGHAKTYVTTVRFGAVSDTDDATGTIEATGAEPVDRAAVEAAVARWTGEVEQVPPAYSAKHVDGRRAYDRARAGEAVALAPETVRIDRIDVLELDWPDAVLEIECGGGTYVRALARDLGEALGVGGHCRELRRTRVGPFDVEDAIGLEALREAGAAVRLLPAESAVADLPVADLDADGAEAAANGRRLPAPEDLPADAGWVRLRGPRGFLGLAERIDDDAGPGLQPRKILYPEGEAAWPPDGAR